MSSFLYRIGRASYRARGRVVAAWLLIVVLLGGLSLTIGGAFDDSFTIPKDEYVVLDLLKQRTAQLGHPAKKSELLRAGIKLLSGLSDPALKKAMGAVPAIKTGRPRSEKIAEVTEKTKAKSGKK